jgi:hypothetical protein
MKGIALGPRLRRAQANRSVRRLRVDPERHFFPQPSNTGLNAVEWVKKWLDKLDKFLWMD